MNSPAFAEAALCRLVCAAVAIGSLARPEFSLAQPKTVPGLMVTFTREQGNETDTTTNANVGLYVPAGNPPTPFLAGGKFAVTWEGFVSVDLRDSYTFQAELNGSLKLAINGDVVLDATSDGPATDRSKRVRLNKGSNALQIHYRSPDRGDAFLRLAWSSPDFLPEPISPAALSHVPGSAALAKGQQLRLGRGLFLENHCSRCHTEARLAAQHLPELELDAPNFAGIGSRSSFDWLARWIEDPKACRPLARMPKMLHGANARADAEAIAAYLVLLTDPAVTPELDPVPSLAESGRQLFETLHCVACHIAPEDAKPDPGRIALRHVRQKFPAGALARFLKDPAKHFEWTRMPDFHLTVEEANQIAASLLSKADAPTERMAPGGDAANRGRQLLATSGCLRCHSAPDQNQFTTRPLAKLAAGDWNNGCLAGSEMPNAPFFGFTPEERAALQAFARTDRLSLQRSVPAEFVERHIRSLNCLQCHGKLDGFPRLSLLGGKLKPEWAGTFLAGEVKYKPRTWLPSRMPAFPKYAQGLAQGMAMQHGFPPRTPVEPPVNLELAQIGRAMISTDGGFSCIACHAVREFGANQVFESPGINLARAGERLQPAYFRRWLNNPLRVDPQTKMPVYFDQGRSPLGDYFEGDGNRQIDALWHYVRLGPKMPLPKEAQSR